MSQENARCIDSPACAATGCADCQRSYGPQAELTYVNDEDEEREGAAERAAAHGLIKAAKAANLPPIYATDGQGDDAIAVLKFFTPWSNWTWYATEFDGHDICFGLVQGHEEELGTFNLIELEAIRGRWGLRIERDLHFVPKPLREVRLKGQG